MRHVHKILNPQGLEANVGPQIAKLGKHGVVQALVAGDNHYWSLPMRLNGAQAIQKAQSVDERHPQIEDNGVGISRFDLAKSGFGIRGAANVVAFQLQDTGERLPRGIVVIHNQESGYGHSRGRGSHAELNAIVMPHETSQHCTQSHAGMSRLRTWRSQF
jgi:hypothetical protein